MNRKRLILRIKFKGKYHEIDLTYLLENWGAPFIVSFMILLITAAVYLAIGNELLANLLAEYAYYALVIGVILQIVVYIKYERKQTHNT